MKKELLYFLMWLTSFFQSWGQACSVASLSVNLQGSIKQYYPFCINTKAGFIGNPNGAILHKTDRFGNLNSVFQFDGQSLIKMSKSLTSFLDATLFNNFTFSFWIKNEITSAAFSHILNCSDGNYKICIDSLYQKIGFSKQVMDSLLQSTVALTNKWQIYRNDHL